MQRFEVLCHRCGKWFGVSADSKKDVTRGQWICTHCGAQNRRPYDSEVRPTGAGLKTRARASSPHPPGDQRQQGEHLNAYENHRVDLDRHVGTPATSSPLRVYPCSSTSEVQNSTSRGGSALVMASPVGATTRQPVPYARRWCAAKSGK